MKGPQGGFAWLRALLFLPDEASTIAEEIDRLHYSVILTTLAVASAIGLTALYFFARYRRRSEDDAPPHVVSPLWFEALVIGVPLALFLGWFAVGFRAYVHMASPPPGSTDVYVTAKQWMWEFAYPEGPNGINVLRVPAHRPMRLLMTSRDVIHSFFVPTFRVKKDVLPGRYTETWFEATRPGRYAILCAEYCGTSHSEMRAEVVVMDPVEFDNWFARAREGLGERSDTAGSRQPSAGNMVEQGQRLAVQFECLRCHTVDGTAHIGPTWLGLYGRHERLDNGQTITVDEAYITESIMDPLAEVVAGYKPVMPTFKGRLDAPEAAAIVEFIKSLRPELLQTGPARPQTYEPIPGR